MVDSLVDVADDSVSGLCLSLFALVEASDELVLDTCGTIVGLVERDVGGLESVTVLRTDGARMGRGISSSGTHFSLRLIVEVQRKTCDVVAGGLGTYFTEVC